MTPSALSRRTFLALAGSLPLAARTAFAASKVPVGLELYSVRDFLAKDLTGTVRAVAGLGYEVVEFYSPYYSWTPQQAADVRRLLDDLGIKCPSTHNGVAAISADGIRKAIDLNQAIGSKAIILASPGPVKTLDDFKALSDTLNAAAETLRPLGMSTGFHNHQREWRPLDGERPMDVIAARTAKDVVLQFDVGTAVEVGVDPVAWIRANPGRIRSMHCKDYSAGGKGYAVLFGEGDVPWKPIFEAAEAVGGIEHYIVEQEAGPADEQMKRVELCLANWKKLRT